MATTDEFSRSRLRQAGEILRRGPTTADELAEWRTALRLAWHWRDSHARALSAARMGLVTRTRTSLGIQHPEVTQRHKRMATILNKLQRFPTMELGRMWDIAGVRVVVPSVSDAYAVKDRWLKRPPVKEGIRKRVADYIAEPKDDGYRAIHLYVNYHDRVVEVQIRSQVMHQWAMLSEELDSVTAASLKLGTAPAEVVEWMSATSAAMATEEAGEIVSNDQLAHLRELRNNALQLLSRQERTRG